MADGDKLVTLSILSYFKTKMDAEVDDKIAKTTPSIGENGHWFIGPNDTGVSASSGITSIDDPSIEKLFE